jgi:hypothetical protein
VANEADQAEPVKLLGWRPSLVGVNNGYVADAQGVLPRADGYAPWLGPIKGANALASQCCGAAAVFDDTGSPNTFAGTATKLYRAVSGSPATWSDVSGGSTFHCSSTDRWQFASFGANTIAVNIDDVPQTAATALGNFAALAGSPPQAKFIRVIYNQVLLGNLSTGARQLAWSGLNSAVQWTPGVNSSDSVELPSGGPITGLGGYGPGIVFQDSAIRRMTFSPGEANGYIIDQVASDRGCIAPYSIVSVGNLVFFLSRDGFWTIDPTAGINPIGIAEVDQWFFDNASASFLTYCQGTADPIKHRVYWAFWSTAATTYADIVLCYDWVYKEWTYARIGVETLVNYVQPSLTLEQLDAYGTLDTLPYSLDSNFWLGKLRAPGYFSTDHALYTWTGPTLAAVIETCDFRPIPKGKVFVSGVTLDIDTGAATCMIGGRERLGDAISWNGANAMGNDGLVPANIEQRYLRARINVPAGQSWTAATELTPEIQPAGAQ